MSNQYEPYPGPHQGPHQGRGPGYPDAPSPSETTQQWQGNTWDSQMQPHLGAAPAPEPGAARTAYLPPVPPAGQDPAGHQAYPSQAGAPGAAYQAYPSQAGAPGAAYQAYPSQAEAPGAAHQAVAHPQPGPMPGPDAAGHRTGAGTHTGAAPYAEAAAPAAAGPQTGTRTGAGAGTDGQAGAGAQAGPDLVGYGPATVGGNARVTDAQRARAEGRSPIIDPGFQPAVLTAALSLLVAGGAALGPWALLLPLVVLQGLTAAGWFRLNGMWPARQGIALGFLGALVADAAVLVVGREHGAAAVIGTLGVWVLLTLVLQLRSHAEPDERMYGLTAALAAAALAILATGHLAAEPEAVTVGGVAVAAAILVRAAFTRPAPVGMVLAVAVAACAGAVLGSGLGGAPLGALAGLCAVVGHRVAAYDYPSRFVHFTAGVALPLALAAPAALLLG
ncbi:hypothetical protein [Streptomyces chilikensis]|uniref:Integral membrane protein n=1 Tax=Streptomyces chilikensis TaxID=1194079 RepID=A0ABV3EYJ8_9ACTN